jgi:hypothetical protein
MATTAFVLLLLAVLVLLGRPAAPPPTRAVPGAAARGVLALARLSDRRRERLRAAPPGADPGVVAHRRR